MWQVITTERFDIWFNCQPELLQDEVLAVFRVLSEFGPQLGRPYVDTVKGSIFSNMKELRIQYAGSPVRAFLPSIPRDEPLCYVLVIKQVSTRSGFIKR